MKSIQQVQLAVILSLGVPAVCLAQGEAATHKAVLPSAVKFQPLTVPGFDPGAKLAVILGDPNAASGDYVVRLAFPTGYRFPAHWHPNAENLTVLSGILRLGMGDKYDARKLQSYPAGSFMYIPGNVSLRRGQGSYGDSAPRDGALQDRADQAGDVAVSGER
jgi:quercetin dioxygenase-like cupin family protein